MNPIDIDAIQNLLMAGTLAIPRTMVCLVMVPLFQSGGAVPRTMRIAMAIGLSLPAVGGAVESVPGSWTHLPVAALALKEVLIGLTMGVLLACPFWVMESVGALLDNQRGESGSQIASPFADGNASVTGAALKQLLVIYLMVTGGVSTFYQLLLGSYEAWPILSLAPGFLQGGVDEVMRRFTEMARLAVLFSAPFVLVLLVIEFAFALIGVAASNFQTNFAVSPAKCLAAFAVLIVYMPTLLHHGGGYFGRAMDVVRALFTSLR